MKGTAAPWAASTALCAVADERNPRMASTLLSWASSRTMADAVSGSAPVSRKTRFTESPLAASSMPRCTRKPMLLNWPLRGRRQPTAILLPVRSRSATAVSGLLGKRSLRVASHLRASSNWPESWDRRARRRSRAALRGLSR